MRTGSLLLSIFLTPGALFASGHLPLPAAAQVHVDAGGFDPSDPESAVCKGFRLTASQVRWRFRTYHELAAGELHDKYLSASCWAQGSVTIMGRSFEWKARPGNTLFTTFPDGRGKMLGGKPSDDLSGR